MITTKQIAEVRWLIEEKGHTCRSAAMIVGVNRNTAYKHLRRLGVKMPHKWGPDKVGQYAAYDRKDSHLVAMGTAAFVGKVLGISANTVYKHERDGTGPYQIVRLADPDGEAL